jgi:hypothetical protein
MDGDGAAAPSARRAARAKPSVSTYPFGVADRGAAARQHVAFERRLI